MIDLDIRTILVVYVLTNALAAAVIGSLWRNARGRVIGTGWWFADAVLQFAAVALIALRGIVPDTLSVLAGSPLVVAGTGLLLHGLERYTGRRPRPLAAAVLGVVFTVVQAFFTLARPSLLARNVALSAAIILLCTRSAWVLRHPADGAARRETVTTTVVFIAYALLGLARIGIDLAVDPGVDLFRSGQYDALVILAWQVLFVTLAFSLLLMVTARVLREERQARTALEESERKFSLAFRGAPHALTITRAADGGMLDVNDAFTAITGYPRAEALATSTLLLGLWVDASRRDEVIADLSAGRGVRNREVSFRARDGRIVDGLLSAEAIDLAGERCVISSIADISALQRAREETRRHGRQQTAIAEIGRAGLARGDPAPLLELAGRHVAAALGVDPALVEVKPAARGSASSPPGGLVVPVGDPEAPHAMIVVPEGAGPRPDASDTVFLQAVATLLATVLVRHLQDEEIGRLNRLYATLSQVNQTIVRYEDRAGLFAGICRVAIDYGGFAVARIAWSETPGASLVTRASATRDGPEDPPDGSYECRVATEAYRAGRHVVRQGQPGDPCPAICLPVPAGSPVHVCAAFPLARRGVVHGVLSLGAREPGFIGEAEVRLLEEIASDINFALDRMEQEEERRRAEESLRERESRFRRLYEESPVAYQSLDPEGRFLDVNPAWLAMLGYGREAVIGRRFDDFLIPEGRVLFAERFPRFLERGAAHGMEYDLVALDGHTISISFDGVFVRDRDGRPAYTHCVLHNITERRRAESQLLRLQTAIEQTGDTVLITGPDETIQYVNPAFETVTGWRREEALGRTPRILHSGVQDGAFYRQMWSVIAAGRSWQGRLVNRRRDGTLYDEEATISPVRDAAGAIVNYVAVKRDISAQLRLEAQFRQAQKMESVGRLAGGVAHDYNNMLQVILSNATLAIDRAEPTTRVRAYLDQIRAAAERSAELTQQLLAFARRQVIAPRAMDLNAAVAGMLAMLRRLIGEDIGIDWNPEPGLWTVMMDPAQLGQVLTNLCVNARDAIGGVGRIDIRTARVTLDESWCAGHPGGVPGDHVRLQVSDTGSGMDRETLERIFEPFFTTKEEGLGTGLGLATVYGIVKQNAGFIDVASEPGRGTTFVIYLPRHGETAAVDGFLAPPTAPRSRGETILVVEDEPAILEIAVELLRELGYAVLAAATPDEAVARARGHPGSIELLLTDVIMPGMNGRDLFATLLCARPGLRCLFMSGYTADVIATRGVLEEHTSFIQKPFATESLAVKVREALDRGPSAPPAPSSSG